MKILDACCGSKMFYFDKTNPNVTFMDIRRYSDILCDGRKLEVNPDVIGDFRNMQFSNDEFDLVVFDPPHLIKAGKNSWLAKKYGLLDFASWQDDLSRGFNIMLDAINLYGDHAQIDMTIEEMSELTKELLKNRRGEENRSDIAMEMTDVYIMLEQLKVIFGIDETEIKVNTEYKLKRLNDRLGKIYG